MKNERYGVGYGSALLSRRVGNLRTAAAELIRIIRTGYDPARIQILPAIKCGHCKGKKEIDHPPLYVEVCPVCSGFGWISKTSATAIGQRGNRVVAPVTKVFYMSGPRRTLKDTRTYLIRTEGDSAKMVRVIPTGPDGLRIICDCQQAKRQAVCDHAETVAAVDRRRFNTEGGKDANKEN